MKKSYFSLLRHLWKAPAALLLLALLILPSSGYSQTFTETFGTAGPKSIAEANAAQDFDNDQFSFGGNASLIAEDLSINASPGSGKSFVYFGDFDSKTGGSADAPPGNERTFTIFRIDNTQLTNIQLSFNLYVDPAVASTTGDFVVEYSTNPGSRSPTYTSVSAPLLTTQGWRTVTINNPFNGVTNATLALRFRRKLKVDNEGVPGGDYIAIDDVKLTGAVAPNFSVSPPDRLSFASTAINGVSAAQSITVTGSGLTNNISVQAPTGYRIRQQGSAAFLAEGATLTLAPTGGIINTAVEVIFNPTTAGTFSGQVAFTSGAINRFVEVSGTAVSPSITVNPARLSFGNVEINTRSGVQSIVVEGANLSGNIGVQVPTGYEFRQSGNASAPFLAAGSTLTLTQTNGSINTVVEIRFAPTTVATFNGNASFVSSGATSQFVAITGAGVAPSPVVTVSPSTIDFPATQIGRTAEPISFFVGGQNLDNNSIIVSSPSTEFLIRLGRSGTFGPQVTLTGTSGTLASTELQVQFSPSAIGERGATIAASSGTTVNSILQVKGNGLAAPTTPTIFISPDPATLDFGTVASNGSTQVLTFKVGGTLLGNNSLIITPISINPENIEIREANVGDFKKGPITFQPINGNVTERTIQVRLAGTLSQGQFQGKITASSSNSNAPNKEVNVIANSTGRSATVSVENTLRSFSTVPGVASDVQSFLVNGSGLIQDVAVRAPAFFQVALQEADFTALNGATGNTVTVVRNNSAGDGFTNPVRVYVRYLPTRVNPQPDFASVNVKSEPAVEGSVQVEGFSAPSVVITPVLPEFRGVESGNVSAPVAVTIRALRVRQDITVAEVLTDASTFNSPTLQDQFEISLDSNTGFGTSVTFSPNQSTFSIDQVIYVRYKPTHIGNALSKLLFSSDDFDNKGFQDFAANTGTIRGNALDNQPIVQTTISVVRSGSTATVSFSPGVGNDSNGSGEGRLVIASLDNKLDGKSQPQDGQTYLSADGTIGQGSSVASGYFSVYTGTADKAVVKGLDPTKAYYFYVFDYNFVAVNREGNRQFVPGAENYLTPTPVTALVPVAAVTPGEPETPLPIELVSFTGKLQNSIVNFTWVTATEKDNKGFEVERSQDGKAFTAILFKNGKGASTSRTTYVAADKQPLPGTSYYRLKQMDYDGKTSFSPVVTIMNEGQAEVGMYPNPVQSVLNIRLPHNGNKVSAQVTITDLTGRVVRTEQLAANGELNVSGLINGTYLVTVSDGTQKTTHRIVKN